MLPFSKNSKSTFLLLLGIIACSILFSQPAQARAKAGFFGDDEEEGDGDDWWGSDEKSDEQPQQGRSLGSGDSVDHSHHHHQQEPVLVAAAGLGSQGVQAASWDPAKQAGGAQSGNFAAHNESCSPTGKSCAREQNLECSTTDGAGRCQCVSGYVYVRQTETCWYIPKSDQEACAHDIQCHSGRWGSHSRCSKETARCECFDHATNGKREATLVDGICYIKKTVGDLCNNHEECDKTIRGDAYCKLADYQSGSGQNYNGSCQCRDSHMHWAPLKACLALSTKLDDKCVISEQCQQGTLGQRSKCSDQGTCQCFSPHNNTEVVYYDKLQKCFKRKEYNDTCTEDDQCRASLGPDVECGNTEYSPEPEDKVCHCPTGRVCRNGAFSTLFASTSFTLSMACVAALVGTSWMRGAGNMGLL